MDVAFPDNVFRTNYCSIPHPGYREGADKHPTVYCRRRPNHPGNHSAFVFLISEPEEW